MVSVTVGRSVRRPIRRATESVYASSSSIPVITPIGVLIADAITATSSASASPSTRSSSGTISAAASRMAASRASASRKPIATVNGSRSEATSGGSTALRMPTIAATATAPPKPFSSAPGAIPAASSSASADPSHAIRRRSGWMRGRSGFQLDKVDPA